jgi:C_GCAxxG_C_C family probable redox protein
MLARLWRLRNRKIPADAESAGKKAGRLFASGLNCAQAVLQATTGVKDPSILKMAEAFGGGIGGSKCLCGAATGAVMALGWQGEGHLSEKLIKEFRDRNGATCCSVLSRPYAWKSRQHRANCRRITEETAEMVDFLVGK